MLKTCLFFLCEKRRGTSNHIFQNELTWAEMIYRELQLHVKDRKLPTYHGDGVLFQCGDHADDDSVDRVCCQKRAIILRMCDVILLFLRDNRAELEWFQRFYCDDWRLVYDAVLFHSKQNEGVNMETSDDNTVTSEKMVHDDRSENGLSLVKRRRRDATP